MRLTALALAASVLPAAPAGAAGEVDFNRDVRPILNRQCLACHGGVKQAAGVSFLYRDDVLGAGESGKPIVVPGDPAASEVTRRLRTSDPDDRMPPPEHHPQPLPPQEIETLARWIQQGAKWGEHWAFRAPSPPALPEVSDPHWPRQELDRFVLARLDAEKLKPSPPAAPAAWLRRASLDLTGLPPTPEEAAAFEQAARTDRPAAERAAVARLLASPAFGERWAAIWLDLARYSDTTGFEKDPHRDIWPFRDWVIRAFEADLPFDRFTVKQLAGDLLENPEPGDLIATAFHRNTQNNTEGGTDDEEYRLAAVIDRVNTTWTAWQGLTFGCVQCHAHPYDPLPHADYYRFMAFFNNTEDVDINSEFPRTKAANDPAQQAEAVRLERAARAAREELNRSALEVAAKLGGWRSLAAAEAAVAPPTGTLTAGPGGEFLTSGTTPNGAVFTLRGAAAPFAAVRLHILPKSDDPAKWSEQGAVVTRCEAALVRADGSRQPVALREVVADFLAGPFDPNDSLRDGNSGFGGFPALLGPRTAVFVPEAPVVPLPGDTLELVLRHGAVCNGDNQNCVLRRFRLELTDDPALAAFCATPERAAGWQQLQLLRDQYNKIPGATLPVMQERPAAARRDTRVFLRGNRLTRGEPVTPGIPRLFAGDGPAPATRLALAEWLVGDRNPLAARVLANRLWAELFGTGLVETLEDFGSSGTPPSHPELLDHLALRLRGHHGWRLKPFLAELVLSATYGQSARATPELLARDPRNRLLARGPRQRLTAEMVRDQSLAVSGLLSPKRFGPPLFPPQPDGVWKSVYSGAKWETSQGEDRFRRAIYTYSKRTSGYPAFLTFDAPTRDICTARRIPTNTPLQALATLNDPAHIEFAQGLAKRMAEAAPELPARLAHGWRLLALTDPSPPALDTLARLHADALAALQQDPAESAKLAPSPEQAALVLVANTLLNSDLALNR